MTDAQNKALYIAQQCKAAGMTLAGAAGVIANIEAESAFKETNLQDAYEHSLGYNDASYTTVVDNGSYQFFSRDQAGYGLAQWTAPDRKANMLSYFKQRGKSIGDFQTQVAFLLSEIKGYSYAWRTCCVSESAYECGYTVCKYYEIPANTEVQAKYRGQLAKNWYDWLKAAGGATSTITTDGSVSAAPGGNATQNEPAKPKEQAQTDHGLKLRTIDKNCRGFNEIYLLQALLLLRGYEVVVSGSWTIDETEAVKAFQEANGLGADCIVGPLTWAKLLERG